MQVGLGELRLSPREFWNATPRELAAAFGTAPPPLSAFDFDDLMKRYPDT